MSMLLQIIKKIFTKKNILIFALILWIAFSIWYVVRDQWQRFQFTQIQGAYQKGSADTVKSLMNQAENCSPIQVIDGDKKIEVIKVGCSSQGASKSQEAPKKEAATPTLKP